MKAKFEQLVPFVQIASAARSVPFYRDTLGFEVSWEYQAESGFPKVVGLTRDDVKLYLTEMNESAIGTKYVLWVSDFAAYTEELEGRGAEPERIDAGHFNSPELRLNDPDGNRLVFSDRSLLPSN